VYVVSTSISRAGDHPGRLLHDPAGRTVGLDDVPAGYPAVADREALKVLITP
jgi:hypothetical protein